MSLSIDDIDARLAPLARSVGAIEMTFPSRISRATLERVENFSSFPGQAIANGDGFIPPAVCHHAYELLRNVRLSRVPHVVTARNGCARGEAFYDDTRLREFTMREVIFFGPRGEVEKIRKRLLRASERLAREIGLEPETAVATDSFFLGTSRGKALMQKIKRLKLELRVEGIALASFNHHEDFFGTRMEIRLPNGEIAHSGCAAFGLERWVHAAR